MWPERTEAHVGPYAGGVCCGGATLVKDIGLRSKLWLECRQGFLLWPESQVWDQMVSESKSLVSHMGRAWQRPCRGMTTLFCTVVVSHSNTIRSPPLAKLGTTQIQRFNSPLSNLGIKYSETPSNRMERTEPYSIQPWASCLQSRHNKGEERQAGSY